jgi:acylphosphatase
VDEPVVLLLPAVSAATARGVSGSGPTDADTDVETGALRLTAWVHGAVQGVGFRWWTRSRALELGLAGWARNLDDGRVEVVAEGPRDAVDRLEALLRGGETPGRVDAVAVRHTPARPGPRAVQGFLER